MTTTSILSREWASALHSTYRFPKVDHIAIFRTRNGIPGRTRSSENNRRARWWLFDRLWTGSNSPKWNADASLERDIAAAPAQCNSLLRAVEPSSKAASVPSSRVHGEISFVYFAIVILTHPKVLQASETESSLCPVEWCLCANSSLATGVPFQSRSACCSKEFGRGSLASARQSWTGRRSLQPRENWMFSERGAHEEDPRPPLPANPNPPLPPPSGPRGARIGWSMPGVPDRDRDPPSCCLCTYDEFGLAA